MSIKELLQQIDKADAEHNPNRRADYADALIEVLRDVFTDDELAELAQAKADGRVVVLPVSVGDTVYVDKGVTVKSAEGWRTKRILFVGKVVSFRKNGNGVFLKIRFSFMEGSKSYMRSYVVSAIGKTVFLTREEAEKALKEREDNV